MQKKQESLLTDEERKQAQAMNDAIAYARDLRLNAITEEARQNAGIPARDRLESIREKRDRFPSVAPERPYSRVPVGRSIRQDFFYGGEYYEIVGGGDETMIARNAGGKVLTVKKIGDKYKIVGS